MPSRYDVLCLSHLRWDFVFQRPQHLLTRFASHGRVLFFEEPVFGPDHPHVETRHFDGIVRCVPHLPEGTAPAEGDRLLARLIDDLLASHKFRRFILWYYTPMAVTFTRHLRPAATVYDCMDELSAFLGAPESLADREGELFDSADLVFTGGRSLYGSKASRHRSVHLFPSSVDAEHFRQARDPQPDPPDQRHIPRPRVGFYGVIDERLDRELLADIAALRPEWSFVMLGPVVKIDEASLPGAPNIHYLGPKRYEELPRYVSGWDVAMMPFARNDSTRFISPTKTPEYLAAGLPVVTTSIADVVSDYEPLGLVRVADDAAAFVQATEGAMAEGAPSRLALADRLLSETSWDSAWAQMNELIGQVINQRERKKPLVPAVMAAPQNGNEATNGNGNAEAKGRPRSARRSVVGELPDTVVRLGEEAAPFSGFDYLVVGGGFAGSVIAERLASQENKKILIVEQRNHIGGNAYDHYDEAGLLVHRYGPHIFHTNSPEVFHYLSEFTEWRPYQHRVRACVNGQLVPIPINLDTINALYGTSLSAAQLEEFFASVAEPVEDVKTSEDVVVRRVGRELYEKFFRNYTRKQWGMDPSELDATVTARVPVRCNRDDRYFTDRYQAMPKHGYTKMFERMLAHPNIKVMLNTSYRDAAAFIPHKEVIFTGPIDEYFDYRFGRLPYRSLEFRFETHDVERYQPAPVVNYPNEYDYTRITEFKYLTGQEHSKTSIVYEFPRASGDPYYPVPRPENATVYRRYKGLAEATQGVHFVGRLATYKYYNMDQVVAQALAVYRRTAGKTPNDLTNKDSLHGAISSAARAVGGHRMHAQPSR